MDTKYLIGIGNYSMRDDGVGIRVIEYIEEHGLEQGFRALDLSGNILNLLSYLRDDVKQLLIVDCTLSDAEPGSFRFFTQDRVHSKKELDGFSTHEGDILKVITLAEQTGYTIPPIEFMAIQPFDVSHSFDLTPQLLSRLPEYVAAAVRRITEA